MICACSLALCGLAGVVLQEAPTPPELAVYLEMRTAHHPGTHTIVSREHWGAFRDKGTWFQFDPEQPEGSTSRLVALPEAAAGMASSLTDTALYINKGRVIWKRDRAGGEWTSFFEAPWDFHGFHVVDDHRVILVWTEAPEEQPRRLWEQALVVRKAKLETRSQAFVEEWDVDAKLLKARLPVPEELARLAELHPKHQAQQLGRIWVLPSESHLLLYVDALHQLYAYGLGGEQLERVRTPWAGVEGSALLKLRKGLPPGSFSAYLALDAPVRMTVSPQPGGGFGFAWFERCLTKEAIAQETASRGSGVNWIFPPKLAIGEACPQPYRFRMGTWRPGKAAVEEVRQTGVVDPNNSLDPDVKKDFSRFTGVGVYITRDLEVQTLDSALAAIRRGAEKGRVPAKSEPPKPPKAVK